MELMKQVFKDFCHQTLGLTDSDKILVAVSGGLDSVLLLYLLHEMPFQIEVAHVNFQLRGEESDGDERFVRKLCARYGVPVYVKQVSAKEYAKNKRLGIQEAAREIRYAWFEELRLQKGLDYLAVGHHQNDVLETMLINIGRGTGIRGLRSIQPKKGSLIRPLLCFDRKTLEQLSEQLQLNYREDSSNASDDYLRNQIRHHVIPALLECREDWVKQAQITTRNLRETEELVDELMAEKRKSIIEVEGELLMLKVDEVKGKSRGFIFELFREFGDFNFDEVQQLCAGDTGRMIESGTHQLLRDRDYLLLRKKLESRSQKWEIHENTQVAGDIELVSDFQFDVQLFETNDHCVIPANQLQFPLTLRSWKPGDWFVPFGMKGRKLVSDYLTDLKLSKFDKEKVQVLCSGEDVVWLVGYRSDDRYKVVDTSEKLYLFRRNSSAHGE